MTEQKHNNKPLEFAYSESFHASGITLNAQIVTVHVGCTDYQFNELLVVFIHIFLKF